MLLADIRIWLHKQIIYKIYIENVTVCIIQ
jgi:hypothetical protein